jgi:hypothetical protein
LEQTPSEEIATKIARLGDWRGRTFAAVRKAILTADGAIVEEIKWRKPSNPGGVAAWSLDGLICTGETYKDKVKATFARGAMVDDPAGLFNASLTGATRRAIDWFEGDAVGAAALTALVRAAIAENRGR